MAIALVWRAGVAKTVAAENAWLVVAAEAGNDIYDGRYFGVAG